MDASSHTVTLLSMMSVQGIKFENLKEYGSCSEFGRYT